MRPSACRSRGCEAAAALLGLAAAKIIVLVIAGATGPGGLERFALRWDGGHFIRIAARGYTDASSLAFAPLYPWLTRLTARALGAPVWLAALVVSNTASVLLFLVLARLYGWRAAVLLYLVPPMPLYTTAAYSESLGLLLLALAVLDCSRRRHARAAAWVALAAWARYVLGLAGLGLLVVALARRDRRGGLLGLLALSISLVLLLAFFDRVGGSPLAYLEAEKAWEAGLSSPLEQARWLLGSGIVEQFSTLRGIPLGGPVYLVRNLLYYAVLTAGLALGAARPCEAGRCGITMTLPLAAMLPALTGVPAMSVPRLALAAFPLLAPVASRMSGSPAGLLFLAGEAAALPVVTIWHMESFFA